MGTWGVGIFSNDCSSDVRDEYRDLVAEGISSDEATNRLLAAYADTLDDPDEGPDFWVGLAAAQSRVGRLEQRVLNRALTVIDDGSDVARFAPADRRRRERELLKLRAVLVGPQRQPQTLKRQTKSVCPFNSGDVLEYLTADGHRLLLVVRGVHSDRGGESARVTVLDWDDSVEMPTSATVGALRPVANPIPTTGSQYLGFVVPCMTKADHSVVADRVRVHSTMPHDAPAMAVRTSGSVVPWSRLDDWFTGGAVHLPARLSSEPVAQNCRSVLPALGTVHRVSFDADLIALRQSPDAAPTQRMKVRHERRVGAGNSLAQLLVGDRSSDYQLVALYSLRATKGTKPVVVVEVSSSTDLDCLEQGAEVTVRGWPTVGRAVALDLGQSVVEAVYPCVSPVFRPMRFK